MANSPTIIVTKVPVTSEQRGQLHTMFDGPAYSLLKQLLIARAIVNQVESMNTALYPDNESAAGLSFAAKERAARLQSMLDELDYLEVNEHEWSLVELERRR